MLDTQKQIVVLTIFVLMNKIAPFLIMNLTSLTIISYISIW